MALESIKSASSQFQETQKTNLKQTESMASSNVTEETLQAVTNQNSIAMSTNEAVAMDGEHNQANDEHRIQSAIKHANNQMKHTRTQCEFSYHQETKRVSIKVIDKDTHEVIREIPPEETLEMVEKMWELAGILVDERR